MDLNVIGRLMVETMNDPPPTRRDPPLAVLDASEETHGNIVGVEASPT